jgi:hypothetical protein
MFSLDGGPGVGLFGEGWGGRGGCLNVSVWVGGAGGRLGGGGTL